MTPVQLSNYLQFAIKNHFPVLIKGKPGIGKSDIVTQAAHEAGALLIISHPVVSDPTDFKGLPFASKDGTAHFLPFEELQMLIDAIGPTVYFLDDLGQAPASVQAACMQLILARRINGFKVSDHVTFIAATNRKEDKAAVSGLLEPVKSRFASIVELEVTTDDWVKWALNNNMPIELIAFIRFRPELLDNFTPTKDIVNSPSPRTVASVGHQQAAGLPKELEYEVYKGAAGEAFSLEYTGFLELFRNMPNIDQIILNPSGAEIPTQAVILYGLSGALAHKMNENNIDAIVTYLDRLPGEIAVCSMKDAITKKPALTNTRAFIKFSTGKTGNMIL
jgi:hypothetical protein